MRATGALGMFFGPGRDRDLELARSLNRRDQAFGRLVAVGRRDIGRVEPAGRIAAQRDDMAHARIPIAAHHRVDLGLARADTGQMRGGFEFRFIDQP